MSEEYQMGSGLMVRIRNGRNEALFIGFKGKIVIALYLALRHRGRRFQGISACSEYPRHD